MIKYDYDKEYSQVVEYCKKGKIDGYLTDDKVLTFGILKYIYEHALNYKNNRELEKGIYKMIHRLIPITLGIMFFPFYLIGLLFGILRSFNKVFIPIASKPGTINHKSYGYKILKYIMYLSEGEIKAVMKEDWYWKIFIIDKRILKMVRKEHMIIFAQYLIDIMKEKNDADIVPNNYIEDEFKKWLNIEFGVNIQ